MTRKSIIRKLIFLPLTVSVFLLCTGSLINFHQHHIWHKPLSQEFVAYKRESEKTVGNSGVPGFSHPDPSHFLSLDFVIQPSQEFILSHELVSVEFKISPSFFHLPKPGIHGLRAPPQA
jgi:hypothetical protein